MQNTLHLNRLRTQLAAELCSHFETSIAARKLLDSCADASSFLISLIAQQLWSDAVLLLAHGLQKRSAVWWACQVCRDQLQMQSVRQSDNQAYELAALDLTERWVRDPQEKYRLAACQAGVAAGNRSPAHWAAMAAFWSTGSMTPDAGVATPAPPFLYARAVASALDFAGARCGTQRDAFYRDALRRGIGLASGGDGTQPAMTH